ncbi:hypothetical protein PIB30_026343 [Stylosanthes scabra]|uniref:Uncharacterized protein n=1 Tax=Stylosanthes scabra TaxID=79078 RepID=A0ABU6YAW8_9FABA|nr:hypothetical protein [Stylosanthes scabra]
MATASGKMFELPSWAITINSLPHIFPYSTNGSGSFPEPPPQNLYLNDQILLDNVHNISVDNGASCA